MRNSPGALLLAACAIIALRAPGVGAGGGAGESKPAALGSPVDRDSLAAMISWLAVDPSTGEPRSRFAPREAEIGEVADTLAARLARYTGNAVARLPFVFVYADSSFTGENLVARLDGTGSVSGAFILSAHFDATAIRTAGWSDGWRTRPAPGANDNATGAAALLESARVLGARAEALPFDVLFALFSAEELDLLGSADFVPRIGGVYGGRVIGVLNLDMIGWAANGRRGVSVLSNPISGWLSDMLVGHIGPGDAGFSVEAINPGVLRSDHQSFWAAGIPAVLVMEPLDDGRVVYPHYHSVLDMPDKVDTEQVGRVGDAAVGFLEGLVSAPAEIELLPSDILLLLRETPTTRRTFVAGDAVAVEVRARNTGTEAPPPGAAVRVDISLRTGDGVRSLLRSEAPAPGPLETAVFTTPLAIGPEHAGENVVLASISVTGMDNDETNDSASLRFGVEEEGCGPVLMHSMQPNPIRGAFPAGAFCMNLARPVDAHLELFSIEGEAVGSAFIGERWGTPLAAGLCCQSLGTLFPAVGGLASGIYLYRLIVYDGSARMKLAGRFAVER